MLTVLQLKRAPAAVRPPAAWFLPGGDAAAWLAEIARWSAPADAVQFFPVADANGCELAGVLAVPPAETRVPPSGRAQPYGLAAPGCFVPVDALVWPPATAGELRAAAVFPVAMFHPAFGLTGWEEADGRRVWDLLAPPVATAEENWSAARAGTAPTMTPPLGAVRLGPTLSPEEVFGPESEEIGSKAPESLPPSPHERWDNVATHAAGSAAAVLVKGLLGLTSLVPRTARAPTWINALENWAQGKLGGITRDLERRRHRELHRLLDLLAKNPEEGLRHAIPLTDMLQRGRTVASAQLGRRNLDFDLGRLGGGDAVDAWDVPADLRTSLSKTYREMAMREQRLGRHRRAACVFAELLGDLAAAADALKLGRHFREAALLYRERLNNPLAAAACLAEGGLLPEAIAIYEEKAHWIEAADLHAKLGNRAAEQAAVRRAAEAHHAAGDAVAAARLIDARLDAPDEALTLLAATWPRGKNALACLEERFALLARRHRNDEARELLGVLARQDTPLPVVAPLAGLLAKLFETAADARVRVLAADAVRVKAAAGLAGRPLERTDELTVLRSLTRLAPEDRLLARDTVRFRESRPRPPADLPASRDQGAVVLRITPEKGGRMSLPRVGEWARVVAHGNGFSAVARGNDGKIFFTQGSWSGAMRSADWPDPAPTMGALFLVVERGTRVFLARPFASGLVFKMPPIWAEANGPMCRVGTPAWLPEDAVQWAASPTALWLVRVVGSRVVLECFEEDRRLESRDVTDELVAAGATGGGTSLVLDAAGASGRVALGYGHHLLVRDAAGELSLKDMGARITGIVPALPRSPGWVVLLERGAAFVTVAPDGTILTTMIDENLKLPRGVFLGDGRLVLVGGEEGIVAKLEPPATARRFAHFPLVGGAGIALLATPHPREFATFTEKGAVQRWQITP